jgi:uncharacterized membrane protein YqjE
MTDIPRFGAGSRDEAYPPGQGPRGADFDETGSISGLLQGIVGNIQNIIRSEIRLAKTEVKEDATTAGKGAGMIAAGAVLGAYALGILLLACIYLLDKVVANWLAALIVAVVVAIVAAIIAMVGLKEVKSVKPGPEQTVDSIKEDIQWAKQQTR